MTSACSIANIDTMSTDSMSSYRLPLNAGFILALLAQGEPLTLYDLNARARLSSGAAVPALLKLWQKKLVWCESKSGRKLYTISESGRQIIGKHWAEFLEKPAKDLADTLKIGWLPLALGYDESAKGYLERSAAARVRVADRLADSAPEAGSLATLYDWAYSMGKAARLRAEAEALMMVAGRIGGGE